MEDPLTQLKSMLKFPARKRINQIRIQSLDHLAILGKIIHAGSTHLSRYFMYVILGTQKRSNYCLVILDKTAGLGLILDTIKICYKMAKDITITDISIRLEKQHDCQGNTIISVTRPPTKIKQEREMRERERNREKRGLAQWF